MAGPALLTIIATVLTVQAGVAEIDLGSQGGLRAQDQGVVFYEMASGEEIDPVDLGSATVLDTKPYTARLDTPPSIQVRRGLLVRFEVPLSRLARADPQVTAAEPGMSPPTTSVSQNTEPAVTAASEEIVAELTEADLSVQELLEQINVTQSALSEAERARAELARRLLETTVVDLESQLARARAEFAKSETSRTELTERSDELAAQCQGLERQLEDSLLEARATEAERQQLAEELVSVRSELAQTDVVAKAAKEALRNEIQQTETTMASLQGQLELREAELASTAARLADFEVEHAEETSAPGNSNSARKSILKQELKLASQALQEAASEKQALERSLRERREEVSRAEAKVAIMQSEIDRLESSSPNNRREIEGLRTALGEARRQIAELEVESGVRDQETKKLTLELASLRHELAQSRGSQPAERGQVDSIPTDLGEIGTEIEVLASAAPCLNFRAEPRLDSHSFDCLQPGTRLGALGFWESWHYVELDGRSGWVSSKHVAAVGLGGPGP